jgi:hypothetical protein
LNVRGVRVLVGRFGIKNAILLKSLADNARGREWMAAYVKVKGFVMAAMGVGTN